MSLRTTSRRLTRTTEHPAVVAREVSPRSKTRIYTPLTTLQRTHAHIPRTIPQALLAALETMPDATGLRGTILPERIPAGGFRPFG